MRGGSGANQTFGSTAATTGEGLLAGVAWTAELLGGGLGDGDPPHPATRAISVDPARILRV
jgi:hypothetical protein